MDILALADRAFTAPDLLTGDVIGCPGIQVSIERNEFGVDIVWIAQSAFPNLRPIYQAPGVLLDARCSPDHSASGCIGDADIQVIVVKGRSIHNRAGVVCISIHAVQVDLGPGAWVSRLAAQDHDPLVGLGRDIQVSAGLTQDIYPEASIRPGIYLGPGGIGAVQTACPEQFANVVAAVVDPVDPKILQPEVQISLENESGPDRPVRRVVHTGAKPAPVLPVPGPPIGRTQYLRPGVPVLCTSTQLALENLHIFEVDVVYISKTGAITCQGIAPIPWVGLIRCPCGCTEDPGSQGACAPIGRAGI